MLPLAPVLDSLENALLALPVCDIGSLDVEQLILLLDNLYTDSRD